MFSSSKDEETVSRGCFLAFKILKFILVYIINIRMMLEQIAQSAK